MPRYLQTQDSIKLTNKWTTCDSPTTPTEHLAQLTIQKIDYSSLNNSKNMINIDKIVEQSTCTDADHLSVKEGENMYRLDWYGYPRRYIAW